MSLRSASILVLLCACAPPSDDPGGDPVLPEQPEQDVPTLLDGTFLTWSGDDLWALAELLSGATPATGAEAAEVDALLDGLGALVEHAVGAEWAITLGLAEAWSDGATKPLVELPLGEDGAPLQLVEVTSTVESCHQTWRTVRGGDVPGEHTLCNICDTLSAAYSLVYRLGKVPAADATETDGEGRVVWKRSFLEQVALDQHHDPAKGTQATDVYRAYERYGATCTGPRDIPLNDPEDACMDLGLRIVAGEDCTLGAYGAEPNGRRVGHAMYARAATWAVDHCEVVVENTGLQGNGNGGGVLVGPGRQTWQAWPVAQDGPVVTVSGSQEGEFNRTIWDALDYICCI